MARKPSQAEIARSVGVSRKTLRQWRDDEGLDLSDTTAVEARAAASRKRADDAGSLADLRRRKIALECRRVELAIQRESENWVPWHVFHRACNVLGAVIRSSLREMEGYLPGQLEGLTPAQMGKALQDAHYSLLERLSSEQFGMMHPETIKMNKQFERCDELHLCRQCRQPKESEL